MTERRHVHRLRLRAARRQDVSRGQQLLAEALRLAALPAEGLPGSLIVRRLELGTLRVGEAPAALALRIAESVRDAASGAVSFLDARAEQAAAVWVGPEPAAAVALARHGAGVITLRLDAWHWPRLVRGLEPALDRAGVQRLAVRAILAQPDPQPTLVELVRLLASEGCADRFVEQLEPALDATLLRAAALPSPRAMANLSEETVRSRRSGLEQRMGAWTSSRGLSGLTRLTRSVVARFGPEHPRSLWLCHVLHLAAAPGRALDPELGLHVVELARHLARSRGVATGGAAGVVQVGLRARAASERASHPEPQRAPDDPGDDGLRAPPAPSVSSGVPVHSAAPTMLNEPEGAATADASSDRAGVGQRSANAPSPAPPPLPSSGWEVFASPQATESSGLFFLLNVLRRLQIASFLAHHPHLADARLAALWLARLARRLEIPVTDSVWAALDASTGVGPADATFVVPGVWSRELYDLSSVCRRPLERGPGVVLVTPGGAPLALYSADAPPALAELGALSPVARREPYPAAQPFDVVLDAWDHAVVGWLERHSELRLPAIVRRPGAVMLTRTHLDVIFDLESADARVRRAALDIDLGYLPWFGRVVSFFYVRRPEHGPPSVRTKSASSTGA
jgi:hypothetical protein